MRFSNLDTIWGRRQFQNNLKFLEKVDDGKQKYTKGGEFVQSNGEKRIHNFLTKHLISFVYDPRLVLQLRTREQWVRPDFYLEDRKMVIEFWGMKHESYLKKMMKKRMWYKECNYNLVEIWPQDDIEKKLSEVFNV